MNRESSHAVRQHLLMVDVKSIFTPTNSIMRRQQQYSSSSSASFSNSNHANWNRINKLKPTFTSSHGSLFHLGGSSLAYLYGGMCLVEYLLFYHLFNHLTDRY